MRRQLGDLLRFRPLLKSRNPLKRTRVLFTASDREVARMNIGLGPCVPLTGRKRPLAGRFSQRWPERPERLAELFHALTGRPSPEAWSSVVSSGPGRLFVLSEAFVERLADVEARRQAATTAEERSELFAAIARDWRRVVRDSDAWSERSSEFEVLDAGWEAGRAARKRQHVYAWYGPGLALWSPEKTAQVTARFVDTKVDAGPSDIRRR